MTLTTHSVIGAVFAKTLAFSPPLALTGAMLSHFVLDALPHWDYKLFSAIKKNEGIDLVFGRDFYRDLFRVGADIFLGLILSGLIYYLSGQEHFWLIILGGWLATLPDYLQFIYGKFNHPVLVWFQKCHNYCHTNHRLNDQLLLGIGSQMVLILVVFISVWFLNL